MKVIIICGGLLEEEFIVNLLKENKYDVLITMEKGLVFCLEHNIVPNIAVGDFDTVGKEVLKHVDEKNTEVEVFPSEKDESDSEIALRKALEMGADEILILGATGGRIDHYIANIMLLFYAQEHCRDRDVKVCIADSKNQIFCMDRSGMIKKSEVFGKYISFFAMGKPVEGLCLRGFKYDVEEFELAPESASRCISNEVIKDNAEILFDSGRLIVMMTKD